MKKEKVTFPPFPLGAGIAFVAMVCGMWTACAAEPGVNVALAANGAVAVADSIYEEGSEAAFGVANAIDGKWIGPGDPPDKNRTSFGVHRPHPHWLWIRFRQPARISRMVLHRAHDVDYPVDFAGEYSPDGGLTFKTLFTVKNNNMNATVFSVERSFTPVVTDNFRLRIDRSSMLEEPNAAQLSEVEVFGEFVEAVGYAAPRVTAREAPERVLKPTAAKGLTVTAGPSEMVFRSRWLRLAVARSRPQITFLSWDSMGRGNVETNLLAPGDSGGVQVTAGTPVFPEPSGARSAPAECEGNVVRYLLEFPNGGWARWEIRVETKSFQTAISWGAIGATVAVVPPGLQLAFDLGVSSVAPLATPPSGLPGPLPLPCLLQHGKNGTVSVRSGGGGFLIGHRTADLQQWRASVVGKSRPCSDGLYVFSGQIPSAEFTFSVERIPVAGAELVSRDPRLWALPRHWLNGFQYRPDLGLLSNNIVSTPCANCLSYQSDVAVFTPPLPGGIHPIQLVRASLDRWLASTAGYGMEMMDGPPSLWISAWDVIRVTGDRGLLARWLPALEPLAAGWKKRDADNNGLYESYLSGNRGDWRAACNAWDCINFGHEDAYSLALGYRGLRCLADLERLAGRREQAKIYDRDADRIRAAYVPTFLNPKTGILAGWKSRDGELHDYWFTVPINGLAISYGLVPDDLGNQIMDRIMAKLREVGYTRFDLGLPWQLVPVARNDYAPGAPGYGKKEDGSDGFQIFVNGGAQAQSYFFIQALYRLGRREEADQILWAEMATYAANGFQNGIGNGGELTRWDGRPCGYEGFLAHCYRDPLALYTGYWGIGFGPEGFYLEPWSPLKGQRVKLGLMYMGNIVKEIP